MRSRLEWSIRWILALGMVVLVSLVDPGGWSFWDEWSFFGYELLIMAGVLIGLLILAVPLPSQLSRRGDDNGEE